MRRSFLLTSTLLLAIIWSFAMYFVFEEKNTFMQQNLAALMRIEIEILRIWQQKHGITRSLSLGDQGKDVMLLQKALASENNDPLLQKITGTYGTNTQNAVRSFQKKNHLAASGTADWWTITKINDLYFLEICPKPEKQYHDMTLVLVNKSHPLPDGYVPPDLIDISKKVKTTGIMCLRSSIVPFVETMFRDARNDGVEFAIFSGFRREEIQKYLYDYWTGMNAKKYFDLVASPGKSEHQLGTTIDVTGASIGYQAADTRFAKTKEGKWLEQHAATYGFVLSYPEGKKKMTGYDYEPWHLRYVGKVIAQKIAAEDITLTEYLAQKQQ